MFDLCHRTPLGVLEVTVNVQPADKDETKWIAEATYPQLTPQGVVSVRETFEAYSKQGATALGALSVISGLEHFIKTGIVEYLHGLVKTARGLGTGYDIENVDAYLEETKGISQTVSAARKMLKETRDQMGIKQMPGDFSNPCTDMTPIFTMDDKWEQIDTLWRDGDFEGLLSIVEPVLKAFGLAPIGNDL